MLLCTQVVLMLRVAFSIIIIKGKFKSLTLYSPFTLIDLKTSIKYTFAISTKGLKSSVTHGRAALITRVNMVSNMVLMTQ